MGFISNDEIKDKCIGHYYDLMEVCHFGIKCGLKSTKKSSERKL